MFCKISINHSPNTKYRLKFNDKICLEQAAVETTALCLSFIVVSYIK